MAFVNLWAKLHHTEVKTPAENPNALQDTSCQVWPHSTWWTLT